jgi:hypothetical protein
VRPCQIPLQPGHGLTQLHARVALFGVGGLLRLKLALKRLLHSGKLPFARLGGGALGFQRGLDLSQLLALCLLILRTRHPFGGGKGIGEDIGSDDFYQRAARETSGRGFVRSGIEAKTARIHLDYSGEGFQRTEKIAVPDQGVAQEEIAAGLQAILKQR